MMPFDDGYHAGLTNDRECPHSPFTFAAIFWHLGNDIGVRIHCAVVESVYLNSTQEEGT
jgi:hypothetical protein